MPNSVRGQMTAMVGSHMRSKQRPNTLMQDRSPLGVMTDSVAAVLGLVSAGIFLAHAIESYRAHALVGAEARLTSFKQGLFRRVQ